MRKVVVPGTFDPITMGHLDVITRSSKLFDEVVVGVAASKNKRGTGTLFTLEERVGLIEEATAHLPNVSVRPFEGLLVGFARDIGASALVKGLRVTTDFESEFQQAALNYSLDADLETLFVMSSPDHMYVSSSIVKEVASLGGDVSTLVPAHVLEALESRLS